MKRKIVSALTKEKGIGLLSFYQVYSTKMLLIRAKCKGAGLL